MEIAKNNNVSSFVSPHLDVLEQHQIHYASGVNEKNELTRKHKAIVNLTEVNKFRKISRAIIGINKQLTQDGLYIGCVQTHQQMREKNFIYKIVFIRSLYKVIDFIFHRVFPKVKGLKSIYYITTNGRNRRLTKGEVLGRLVCHGFEIVEVNENIDGKLYFVVKKVKEVLAPVMSSYGPLYKMPRIGKDGKEIKVFKLRTMHPYSEYLQDYVLKQNGYAITGKPANDFRLASWGKVLRKYWLDELPQLINVCKGDMKIVGVRPVSTRYFQDIPPHLRDLRLTAKPGCIPPYVVFNKKGAKDDVLLAEEMYLRFSKTAKANADASLVYLAFKNVVFKGLRSA